MPPSLLPPRLIRWALTLMVLFLCGMTVLRLGTFFVFLQDRTTLSQAWPAFWLGLRFDARVVAGALLPLLALGAIPWLNPFKHTFGRRFWFAFFGLFAAALIVFYTADYLHYRYLGQRLNATALEFLGDAAISFRMAWESYPLVWITLIILASLVVSVAAIRRLHLRAAAAETSPRKLVTAAWFVVAVFACVISLYGRLGQYPLRWSDAFNLRSAAGASLALNPIESFTSSLNFRRAGYDIDQVRAHYARMAAYLGVNEPDAARFNFSRTVPAQPSLAARRPNIVLVLCESFSGYKSSMWGNPLDPTPFFHSLTREGVFFDNAHTPHFGTARGVWALITGIPDVSLEETASRNPAMVDQHTIINDFDGYEKFYFLGGSSSWANIRGLLTNNIAGLKLYEENSYDSPRIDVWGISDKNLFLEADKVLRTQDKPFFAVIQTADNHRPYTIPEEDLGEFEKVEVADGLLKQSGFESLAELNAFRYTDFAFKKFMEAARTAPYFENTIFVFIGDHGIGGDAGKMFPPSWTENHLTRFHVPLLFYGPKLLAPQRVHSAASMVDVLPTIAGMAGIRYRNTALGRDLLQRQPIDDGAGNIAFIMDHNDKTTGVIRGPYYGVQRIGGEQHALVWADFASPPPHEAPDAGTQAVYRTEAEAFYETARYLLLHNQKPESRAP